MSKKVLTSYAILSAQSLAASFNSASTNVQFLDRISYSGSWTGSAVGSLIAQGSADGTNFANLDMNAINLNNASDSFVMDIQCTSLPYVRLAYTRSSGTGSMTAVISGKES